MKTELQKIPGIGPKMEEDLVNMGFHTLQSLKGQNPETLYQKDCVLKGCQLDRCVLYVFRCAVYFAENKTHDPEKLKWWNWKD